MVPPAVLAAASVPVAAAIDSDVGLHRPGRAGVAGWRGSPGSLLDLVIDGALFFHGIARLDIATKILAQGQHQIRIHFRQRFYLFAEQVSCLLQCVLETLNKCQFLLLTRQRLFEFCAVAFDLL